MGIPKIVHLTLGRSPSCAEMHSRSKAYSINDHVWSTAQESLKTDLAHCPAKNNITYLLALDTLFIICYERLHCVCCPFYLRLSFISRFRMAAWNGLHNRHSNDRWQHPRVPVTMTTCQASGGWGPIMRRGKSARRLLGTNWTTMQATGSLA